MHHARPRPRIGGLLGLMAPLLALAVALSGCAGAAAPAPAPKPTAASAPAATSAPAAQAPAATQPPAPTAAPTTAPTPVPQKVKLGTAATLSDGPFFIAQDRGYFAQIGLDVEFVNAPAGDLMAPLGAGQFDIVGGGFNIGTFNAVANNLPIAAVANRAYLSPGADGDVWMYRTDLADRFRSFADLRGRKVAINSPSSPLVYMLGKTLEKYDLRMDDVEVVAIGFPDMVTAFGNGAIDAGIQVEPFVARAEDLGVARRWAEISTIIGPMETSAVFWNTDWARRNPQLATNFLVAYLRGAREYLEAMNHGPNRAYVVDLLIKNTPVKEPALYDKMTWIGLNPNGRFDKPSLQDQINWYARRGDLRGEISADRVIDETHLNAALAIVGEVREGSPR